MEVMGLLEGQPFTGGVDMQSLQADQRRPPTAAIAAAYAVIGPFVAGLLLWTHCYWHMNPPAKEAWAVFWINLLAYGMIAVLLAGIPAFVAGWVWAKAIPRLVEHCRYPALPILALAGGLGIGVAAPYRHLLSIDTFTMLASGAFGGACVALPLLRAMNRSKGSA